jgi:hypothetical protein
MYKDAFPVMVRQGLHLLRVYSEKIFIASAG